MNKRKLYFSILIFLVSFCGVFVLNIEEAKAWVRFYPAAPGDATNLLQYPTDGSNFDKHWNLYESRYVYTKNNTTEVKDLYYLNTNFSFPAGNQVDYVDVHFFVMVDNDNPINALATPYLKLYGVELAGTTIVHIRDTAGAEAEYIQRFSRPGGGNWSWTDVQNLQIGIGLRMSNPAYYGNNASCDIVFIEMGFSPIPPPEGVWGNCETGTLGTPQPWPYMMGYKFTPTQNGNITKLCGYFQGTKTVNLYNSAFSIIATASVASAANWSCTSIAPVSVTANSVYYVAANIAGSGGYYRSATSFPMTCGMVTINNSFYQAGATFNAGHTAITNFMYGMADVVFTSCLSNGSSCPASSACCSGICSADYFWDGFNGCRESYQCVYDSSHLLDSGQYAPGCADASSRLLCIGDNSWTASSCGSSSCSGTDYCDGTTFYDYPTSCNNSCSSGSCTSCTCTATQTPNSPSCPVSLNVSPQPTNGNITSNTGGINCGTLGSICQATYNYNTPVILTAAPSTGYSFTSWSGCDSTSGNTCNVTMTAIKNVTANFAINTYALNVTKPTTGNITSNTGGINCGTLGSICQATYNYNTPVILTAAPSAGYSFTSWSGCDSTSGNTCNVTMTAIKNVAATFIIPIYVPTVTTEAAAINLKDDKATAVGTVVSNGGAAIDNRYIDWDTVSRASGGSYANTVTLGTSGDFSTLMNITPGIMYYYRARAHNSAGDGYGTERKVLVQLAYGATKDFTTLSDDASAPISEVHLLNDSVDPGDTWHKKPSFTRLIKDTDIGESGLDTNACHYSTYSYGSGTTKDDIRSCNAQKSITVSPEIGNMCRNEGRGACQLNVSSKDLAGNESEPYTVTYNIDWTDPIVGNISPLSVESGENTFSVSVKDSTDIDAGCYLYVDYPDNTTRSYSMDISGDVKSLEGGTASQEVTLVNNSGNDVSYGAYVWCVDHWDVYNLEDGVPLPLNDGSSEYATITVKPKASESCNPGVDIDYCQSGSTVCPVVCLPSGVFPTTCSCSVPPSCNEEDCQANGTECGFPCGGYEKSDWTCNVDGYCEYSCSSNQDYCAGIDPDPAPFGECLKLPPTVSLTPHAPQSKIGEPGQPLKYVVRVDNWNKGETEECLNEENTTFDLTKECLPGWDSCLFADDQLSIDPQHSAETILTITSPSSGITKGDYAFSATITGSAGSDTADGIYTIKDQVPVAEIGCYPEGCDGSAGPCTGYKGEFCLKNISTDEDGQDDIKSSVWDISGRASLSCINPLCDWLSDVTGSRTAKLTVTDWSDIFDESEEESFYIKEDISADFSCGKTLPEDENNDGTLDFDDTWKFPCIDNEGKLKVNQGDTVYFADIDYTPNHSEASEGATLRQWCWAFQKADKTEAWKSNFTCYSEKNKIVPTTFPTTNSKGSGRVILKVTDNAWPENRNASNEDYEVRIVIPLPGWSEGTP